MLLHDYNEVTPATRQRPEVVTTTSWEAMMSQAIALTDAEQIRFWAKVDKDQIGTGCWEWTAALVHGYGQFTSGDRRRGYKKHLAHRLVYQMLVGPVPDGLELDHLCRNTSCCNSAHVEPVTHAENIRRCGAMAKASAAYVAMIRRRTECPNGHDLDAPDMRANAACSECARERKARQEARWTPAQREAKREYVRQWRARRAAS